MGGVLQGVFVLVAMGVRDPGEPGLSPRGTHAAGGAAWGCLPSPARSRAGHPFVPGKPAWKCCLGSRNQLLSPHSPLGTPQ